MVPRSPTTVDELPAGARTPRKVKASQSGQLGDTPIWDQLVREHGRHPITGEPATPVEQPTKQPSEIESGSDGA